MTKNDPLEMAITSMVQATIRNGLQKGIQPSPGVIVLHQDQVRDILHTMFPHLKPGADPNQDSANITLTYSPEGMTTVTHTNLKTGEVTNTPLNPDVAVNFGTMMIQFGALSKVGMLPPPQATHDAPTDKQ